MAGRQAVAWADTGSLSHRALRERWMTADDMKVETSVIAGILRVGEANATVEAIARRQRGSQWYYWAALVLLDTAGAFAGAKAWPERPDLGIVAGVLIATVIYVQLARRWTVARVRSRFAKQGLGTELDLSMQILSDVFCYRVGDVDQRASWRAVTELFHSRHYWIFLVQGSAWFLPQRFFAEKEAERAFIGEALLRMTDEARARSPEATAFSRRAGGE
jgi:hypothetical protein